MSDSLAPRGFVAKLIDIGARRGSAAGKRRALMRFTLVAAVIPLLVLCNVAMAQISGMASPTPTIGATSPLGLGTGSTVSPTGIPLGSTEIASPGVSPAPGDATGTIAMPSSSTTCSTIGTAPSSMFGSTASFDGGGMGVATAAPATATTSGAMATSGMSTTSGMLETSGMSGMCGSGSSSIASSSTPTTPTTPGGAPRTGIPLGSTEIGNLGVSSAAAVPTMTVSPTAGTVGLTPLVPTMPMVASPSAVSSPTTNLFPCLTGGTAGTSTGGC
jgi:hypothetical protein